MTKYTVHHMLPYPEGSNQVAVHADMELLAAKTDAEIRALDVDLRSALGKTLSARLGKNLYNPARDEVDSFMTSSGDPASLEGYRMSNFIAITAGRQYTISAVRGMAQYDIDLEFVPGTYQQISPQQSHTFTAQVTGFMRFAYQYGSAHPDTVQVEQGPNVTTYEPYQEALDLSGVHITGLDSDASTRGAIQVLRDDDTLHMTFDHQGDDLTIRATLAGRDNQVFNFLETTLQGVRIHYTADSVAPIRTTQSTIGANHGFLGCATWAAGAHDKTVDDIGSLWDHDGETVVLLHVDETGRAWVGRTPTVEPTGEYSLRSFTVEADLTHISGAVHTNDLAQVSVTTGSRQLYPAVKNVQNAVTLDGHPVTEETRKGDTLIVRESYEILDLAGIHDAVRATPGVPFPQLDVRSAVLVENEYRFRAGGVCETWSAITEVTPTRLNHCGFIQAEALDLPAIRYAPGVAPKNGVDWPSGVNLDDYSVSQNITTDDLTHPGAPPVMTLDVRDDIAFVIGLHPWKPGASQAPRRIEKAPTRLWDMRSSRKSYPVVTNGEAPGWGRLEAHGIRAYLAPVKAQKIIDSGDSAYAAWAALETQTKFS